MDNKAREAFLKTLPPDKQKVQNLEFRVLDLEKDNNYSVRMVDILDERTGRSLKDIEKLQTLTRQLKNGLWQLTEEQEKKAEEIVRALDKVVEQPKRSFLDRLLNR